MDCGPTCLRMIAKHFRKNYTLAYQREKAQATKQGVSLLNEFAIKLSTLICKAFCYYFVILLQIFTMIQLLLALSFRELALLLIQDFL